MSGKVFSWEERPSNKLLTSIPSPHWIELGHLRKKVTESENKNFEENLKLLEERNTVYWKL